MDVSLAKKAYSVYLHLFEVEAELDEYFLHYMKIFWEDLEVLISSNDIANPRTQEDIYFFKLFYSYLLRISKLKSSNTFANYYTLSIISYLISYEDKIRQRLSERASEFPYLTNHFQLVINKYQQFSISSFAAILDRQYHHEYQKVNEEFFKLIGVDRRDKSNNKFIELMTDYYSILLVDLLNDNSSPSHPPSTPFDELLSNILSSNVPIIHTIVDLEEKLAKYPLVVTHLIDLVYRLVNNDLKVDELEQLKNILHKWLHQYGLLLSKTMPYYITLPYLLQFNPQLLPHPIDEIDVYVSQIPLSSTVTVQKIINLCIKFENPVLASSFANKFASQLQSNHKFAESIFWYAKEIQMLMANFIPAVKQIRNFSAMLTRQIESDQFIEDARETLGDLDYIIEVLSSFQLFDKVDLEFLRQYNKFMNGDKNMLYVIMEKMTAPKKFWIPILFLLSDPSNFTLSSDQIKIALARLEELHLVHTKIARNYKNEILQLRKKFSEILSASLLSN